MLTLSLQPLYCLALHWIVTASRQYVQMHRTFPIWCMAMTLLLVLPVAVTFNFLACSSNSSFYAADSSQIHLHCMVMTLLLVLPVAVRFTFIVWP